MTYRRYRPSFQRNRHNYAERIGVIRPTKAFDVTLYLRDEFLRLDQRTFEKVTGLYRKLYGDGAYRYMLKSYEDWKQGYVKVSNQTTRRILECIPKYLSNEKRFHILKNEIVFFMEELHHRHKNKPLAFSEVDKRFELFANDINNFQEVNLKWFVAKGIFPQDEINNFLIICRYALSMHLIKSYNQVQNDLKLVSKALRHLPSNKIQAKYTIDFLQSTVILTDLHATSIATLSFSIPTIAIEGKFKKQAEKYLIEELLNIRFSTEEGVLNRQIAISDLNYTTQKFFDFISEDLDAHVSSHVKGEGGTLNLILETKSVRNIQLRMYYSLGKLILILLLIGFAIKLYITYKPYEYIVLIIIAALVVVGFMFSEMETFLEKLKEYREQKYL